MCISSLSFLLLAYKNMLKSEFFSTSLMLTFLCPGLLYLYSIFRVAQLRLIITVMDNYSYHHYFISDT